MQLLLDSLRSVRKGVGALESVQTWNAATMCEQEKVNGRWFHKPDCVRRLCDKCGMLPVKKLLEEDQTTVNQMVKYSQWISKKFVDDSGTTKTRIIKQENEVSVQELVKILVTRSEGLSLHLHTAAWQHHQYNILRDNPNSGELILLADFSENLRLEHQR